MNRATKAAIVSIQANQFDLKAAFFHSTPVLDRKRRSHWDYKGNAYAGSSKRANYYRNSRKLNSKQELLRNVSAFAENLFQGLDYDVEYEYEHEPSSSRGRSWFRTDYRNRGFKSGGNNRKGSRAGGRRGFQFCEDDDGDVETLFRSAFGGNKYFFWSFVNDEPHRSSTGYHNNNSHSWNWKWTHGENYDTDSDSSPSDLTTERKALGLSTSGPLNADDVKNAYRKCAMKWHPDRHQGSSKVVAEEKFKVCSAAYQTLCDKLAVN